MNGGSNGLRWLAHRLSSAIVLVLADAGCRTRTRSGGKTSLRPPLLHLPASTTSVKAIPCGLRILLPLCCSAGGSSFHPRDPSPSPPEPMEGTGEAPNNSLQLRHLNHPTAETIAGWRCGTAVSGADSLFRPTVRGYFRQLSL